jgi:hypothetical protein
MSLFRTGLYALLVNSSDGIKMIFVLRTKTQNFWVQTNQSTYPKQKQQKNNISVFVIFYC